jgi:Zn-dependent peptidase ImmA (M78 family)/DNA-binding XRE family transcriptional regulator
MNRPVFESRLTHLSVLGLWTWERLRTAPRLALSPVGLLRAIFFSLINMLQQLYKIYVYKSTIMMYVCKQREDLMKNFGERLHSARIMAGLSMDRLVEKLGGAVSKQSISKYERGLMKPEDSNLLLRLSRALNVPVDYFFRDSVVSLDSVDFRKKASLGVKELSSIIEQTRDELERYFELEALLAIEPRFVNPVRDLKIDSTEDVETAAKKLRRVWGLGVMSPITRVFDLLEENEVRVVELDVSGRLDGLSGMVQGIPVVLSQRGAPVDRRRFTALHELGHLILRFTSSVEPRTIEKYCHCFAAAMLLPSESLKKELGKERRSAVSLPELVHLKEHYGISIQAAMARIHALGIIGDSAYRQFNIFVNVHKLREKEPGEYPLEEKATRFTKLLHRALAEGVISLSKAAVLARIPIEKLQQEMVSGG